jgi:hypothetical protein
VGACRSGDHSKASSVKSKAGSCPLGATLSGAGSMMSHEPPMEISKGRRYFLFGMACTHVLLASGEAYGWTALRPVLMDAGFFAGGGPKAQSEMLTTMATMGIAGNALCKLPLGMLLDKYGPRATAVVGAVMVMVGSLLIGAAALLHPAEAPPPQHIRTYQGAKP